MRMLVILETVIMLTDVGEKFMKSLEKKLVLVLLRAYGMAQLGKILNQKFIPKKIKIIISINLPMVKNLFPQN